MLLCAPKGILRSLNSGRFLLYISASLFAWIANPPRVTSQQQQESSGQLNLQVIVGDSSDKAHQILDCLRNGEDFAAVARKESIDPSATEGGYLGLIDLSTLRPEL